MAIDDECIGSFSEVAIYYGVNELPQQPPGDFHIWTNDQQIAAAALQAVLELAKANREAIAELKKEIKKLRVERGEEE